MSELKRSQAQAATSRVNGAASKGPTSVDGRNRSATNAVSHGLNAKNVLLPGESEAEFQDFIRGWLSSLAPTTFAEAQLVLQIVDTSWRLKRLRHIEHGHQLGVLQRNLMKSGTAARLGYAEQAERALAALVQLLGEISSSQVPSVSLTGLLPALSSVLAMVNEVEQVPLSVVAELEKTMNAIATTNDTKAQTNAGQRLLHAAQDVQVALKSIISNCQSALVELEVQIAPRRCWSMPLN